MPDIAAVRPRAITPAAVDLVRHFEGLYLTAYLCPAGVPTIGYGHTRGVTVADVGKRTITAQQADALLAADLDEAAGDVDRLVRTTLTANELGALTSFVFNLGAGAFANSTLLRKLNNKDIAGAESEFGHWVHAAGRVLPGLVARRIAEAALFRIPDGFATPNLSGGGHPMPQMLEAPSATERDRIKAIQRVVGATMDGTYGPKTRAAVAAWQGAHGLVADGVVGPVTAAAMGLGVGSATK